MKTFQAMIAAIVVVAVAANPVAAMLTPCCCSTKVERRHSCCEATGTDDKQHACGTGTVAKTQRCLGCCCVDKIPSSPASYDNSTETSAEKTSLDDGVCPEEDSAHTLAAGRHVPAVRNLPVSGPPLRALYCIWLN